ncbi:hypothetical protein ACGFJ7_29605 [Actinoplanes sp. NPDC048988]|uniref:hypothetical protein n=1 Tax=Actinoplanes sp. NPDC048988 TaxID=3363901 RepID=UPI0037117A6E
MSTVLNVIHDGTLAVGVGTALYAVSVTAAAVTALTAPSRERRRDARAVLALLVRNRRSS